MDKAVLRLAAHLLQEYADELSNRGCNDTTDEVRKMIKEIGKNKFRKMANEWNCGECEYPELFDDVVANVIANKLEQMSAVD